MKTLGNIERNVEIVNFINEGHTQADAAKTFKLHKQLVSRVFNELKFVIDSRTNESAMGYFSTRTLNVLIDYYGFSKQELEIKKCKEVAKKIRSQKSRVGQMLRVPRSGSKVVTEIIWFCNRYGYHFEFEDQRGWNTSKQIKKREHFLKQLKRFSCQ